LFLPLSNLSAQLFNYTKIESPNGFNFNQVIGEFQDGLYLSYWDDYYNNFLYKYADGEIVPIDIPVGFNFGRFLTIVDDRMYIRLNDDYFNGTLAAIENDIVTIYPASGDATDLGQFVFEEEGKLYLQYFNGFTFDQEIKTFDGANFEDFLLPAGLGFDQYLGELDGKQYMFLEAAGYESVAYSLSNGIFELIPSPDGLQFPFTQFIGSEIIIFSAFDYNFNQFFYEIKNDEILQLDLPPGFEFVTSGPVEWKNDLYFGVADTNFDNDILAKRLSDGTWDLVTNPTGLQLDQIFENGLQDDVMNLSYLDPNTFDNSLAIYNGTDFSEIVPPPTDFDLNGFVSEYKGGNILTYFEAYYYNNTLWFYKDGELSQAPSPTEHPDYSFFGGRFGSNVYLVFQESYYSRTLYQLSLNARPESADSTVTTFAESPYKFKLNDFPFTDSDIDGAFGGIQISVLPEKGILHLNGAQINVGDIVPVADLTTMFYVPLDAGIGSPYDQFKFRVWDSFEVSELDYTMFINVLSTSSTKDDFLSSLFIYPNPASDFLNINLNDEVSPQDLRLSIIDESGKIVLVDNFKELNQSFLIENLPSGNYFVIIYNEERSALRKLSIIK